MRMEVHVHGTAFLCKGVHLSQVEDALRPWLDYLEVDAIAKVQSMEREEPGIQYDPKEQALDMCWTGEVGRSFQGRLAEAFKALGPLTEYASEVTLTSYHDNGKEEFQQIFIGPTAEAIHEIRRQCVEEDLSALLAPQETQPVKSGLVWRVFEEFAQTDGSHRLVAQSEEALPTLRLPDGAYIVHAEIGRAHV